MKILFIGDIVGRPGREAIQRLLPEYRRSADFVIANGENAAGGRGITPALVEEFHASGVDCITLGNHAFDRKEIRDFLDDPRVLRPANYPPGVPGNGFRIYETGKGRVAVLALLGRTYLANVDCPFQCARRILEKLPAEVPLIVDMHAEITSEKQAMGWFLDGRAAAVFGTHTHVQTADERILPGGCAFLTDVGMTGPLDSVIGMEKEAALRRFLTGTPVPLEVASGRAVFNAVKVETEGPRAVSVERIFRILEPEPARR